MKYVRMCGLLRNITVTISLSDIVWVASSLLSRFRFSQNSTSLGISRLNALTLRLQNLFIWLMIKAWCLKTSNDKKNCSTWPLTEGLVFFIWSQFSQESSERVREFQDSGKRLFAIAKKHLFLISIKFSFGNFQQNVVSSAYLWLSCF